VQSDELAEHDHALGDIASALVEHNATVLTGACHGFPMALAAHARSRGATVIGFSPGANLAEHVGIYESPVGPETMLLYVGGGLIQREVVMIRQCDVAIALGGNIGTLCETLMCIKDRKRVIVAEGIGQFAPVLRHVLEHLVAYPEPQVSMIGVEGVADYIRKKAASWAQRGRVDASPVWIPRGSS
jgi:uncharacterized protein (TIGR00725 family)